MIIASQIKNNLTKLKIMKKIYILLAFCLLLSHVKAQGNATIQQTENIPNWPVMLSNLDTSQITSGVLIDKVTTFANIINYNTTESNISSNQHFLQALSELYRASDQTKFISLSELKNRTTSTTANNSVDIGIINTTFHKLNFNEENPSVGGVTYNETTAKYVPVSGSVYDYNNAKDTHFLTIFKRPKYNIL